MAITALNKITATWYTPEDQKEEERPARFKLRPLSPSELESVMEVTNEGLGVPPKNYGQVLKLGLTDWENIDDTNGRPIKHKWTEHNRLNNALRFELTMKILDGSELTEEEVGNSD